MSQHLDNSQWIGAYLEWTETEPGTPRQYALSGADDGADDSLDIAVTYLEWIDAAPLRDRRARAPVSQSSLSEDVPLMEALHNIEADVRALSGRILELRAH